MKCGKYNVSYVWLMIDKKKKVKVYLYVCFYMQYVCMYVQYVCTCICILYVCVHISVCVCVCVCMNVLWDTFMYEARNWIQIQIKGKLDIKE